jgi:hypothetical protein
MQLLSTEPVHALESALAQKNAPSGRSELPPSMCPRVASTVQPAMLAAMQQARAEAVRGSETTEMRASDRRSEENMRPPATLQISDVK